MALVIHLKPHQLITIANRRVGLSIGRDALEAPPVRPPSFEPGPNGLPRVRPDVACGQVVRGIEGRMFMVIELGQGEDVHVGGARVLWDMAKQRGSGRPMPSLLVDAPRDTHPVKWITDTFRLARADLLGLRSEPGDQSGPSEPKLNGVVPS